MELGRERRLNLELKKKDACAIADVKKPADPPREAALRPLAKITFTPVYVNRTGFMRHQAETAR